MSLRFETVVQRVEGLSPEGVLRDRRGRRPPPVLPQMPTPSRERGREHGIAPSRPPPNAGVHGIWGRGM
jgi:hypothetical protein